MDIAIAGIHTGIGKTVCSSVLCQAMGFDYWKPVQAGDLEHSDTMFVQKHIHRETCIFHPERYRLLEAASPHYAASLEQIEMKKEDFVLPESQHSILVETAGGLMSPLGADFLIIDLISHLHLPVILVSSHYLGSINHTLLSHALLKSRNIEVIGIVFVGKPSAQSEQYILEYTQLPLLFSIPHFDALNPEVLQSFANSLEIQLPQHG